MPIPRPRNPTAVEQFGTAAAVGLTLPAMLRECVVATLAKRSSRLQEAQRRRTLERFHGLGSAVIEAGVSSDLAQYTGALARVGVLRNGPLILRAYVAGFPGQLAGNTLCPQIGTRHEIDITAHNLNTGEMVGWVHTAKHEGHREWAPRGEVVAAPIREGVVRGEEWALQQPHEIAALHGCLTQLSWAGTVPIHPHTRDPFAPLYT